MKLNTWIQAPCFMALISIYAEDFLHNFSLKIFYGNNTAVEFHENQVCTESDYRHCTINMHFTYLEWRTSLWFLVYSVPWTSWCLQCLWFQLLKFKHFIANSRLTLQLHGNASSTDSRMCVCVRVFINVKEELHVCRAFFFIIRK